MTIIAHMHTTDADGKEVHAGYVCGYPYATESQQKRFTHARSCGRRGKPFIRLVLTEAGTDYLCPECKRLWVIPEEWYGLRMHQVRLPDDWWAWRYAGAKLAQQEGRNVTVQECGQGLIHLLRPDGFDCGRAPMDYPMTIREATTWCQRCAKAQSFMRDGKGISQNV